MCMILKSLRGIPLEIAMLPRWKKSHGPRITLGNYQLTESAITSKMPPENPIDFPAGHCQALFCT